MKNKFAKVRPLDNPYEIWEYKEWKWLVLKKWQINDNKLYARAFCFVTSPMCPDGEYGGTYIADYKAIATCTKTNYDLESEN